MNSRHLARAGPALLAAVIILSTAQAAYADTPIGGTAVLTIVGTPTIALAGASVVGQTMWSNHLSVNVTAIVIVVVKNSSGQTVYYSTGSVTVASGGIGTAADVIFAVPNGTYTATFFAFTLSGVAISTSSTASLTLPL